MAQLCTSKNLLFNSPLPIQVEGIPQVVSTSIEWLPLERG